MAETSRFGFVDTPNRAQVRILGELAHVYHAIGRSLRRLWIAVSRLSRLKLPRNPDNKVLIHLGCGDVNSPEFINVDARPARHVHYVRDVTDLSVFRDDYADLVYACHVLEHVRRDAMKKTLQEWKRIIKPGGILRLSVPDFDAIVGMYQACGNDIDSITGPLMGGQVYAEDTHYTVFNTRHLTGLLKDAGFQSVRTWDPRTVAYHAFDDWASRLVEKNGKAYCVSLNLEAVKGH